MYRKNCKTLKIFFCIFAINISLSQKIDSLPDSLEILRGLNQAILSIDSIALSMKHQNEMIKQLQWLNSQDSLTILLLQSNNERMKAQINLSQSELKIAQEKYNSAIRELNRHRPKWNDFVLPSLAFIGGFFCAESTEGKLAFSSTFFAIILSLEHWGIGL